MSDIAVVGANGHTGRFVVAELERRGMRPVSTPEKADAVINCAGPFAATARPVLDAALAAGIPYLDITAEVEVVLDTFARDVTVPVVPAMAFFGGLGDLLATAAMGDWPAADSISLAYALSSWRPTKGTRATGRVSAERRNGRRILYTNHRMESRDGPAPITEWTFPAPIGTREVVGEFTTADSATIPTHLKTPEIHTCMTLSAVDDLRDDDPTPPDGSQTFLVEAVVSAGGERRRAVARGRDIYAVTAPLVVEATSRILARPDRPAGVFAPGALFDARDFLTTLGLLS